MRCFPHLKAEPVTEQKLIDDLQDVARTLQPKCYPSIERSARALNLSVRTLQRRLQHAKLSYSELIDQVRHEDACQLLQVHSKSIADIARQLGYSDPSHFSRAFRRWEGVSPRAYRASAPSFQNR